MEVIDQIESSTASAPALSAKLRGKIHGEFRSRFETEWGGKFATHGLAPGPNAVRLDGNDYLAVTGHPHIVQAQLDAIRQGQEFIVQSGVFQLQGSPASRLEGALASWLGHEEALLCQSGYAANLGLLQVIADAETPVYLDSLAHMSLWEGVKAAGAPAHAFRHNDVEHLAKMCSRHGPGIVVVDSVYSTTGAVAPLREVVETAERHQCMILVDESHSLGTHGPGGKGLCAMLGLTDRVHFITASLAKAFAGRAGFFTMPRELRYYLMSHSRPSIFSSCLLPHEIAGLAATLDVVKQSDRAREQLHANTRRVRSMFTELGYPIHQGTEQIISLEAGTETNTLALRDALEAQGVFGAVFFSPATSRNRAMVRLTLSAALTDAEMDHVEAVARSIAPRVKPWEWPIARRAASRGGQAA
jgi:CAI-1 autoinducer synthase